MSNLKPCPFCGKNNWAEIEQCGGLYNTYCQTCDCKVGGCGYLSKEDVILVLNTRPVEDALRQEIDNLKKQVEG